MNVKPEILTEDVLRNIERLVCAYRNGLTIVIRFSTSKP